VGQAFFCPDFASSAHATIVQAGEWRLYQLTANNVTFGGRRLSEVGFPSQKVHVFDTAQWQGVKAPVFFLYPFARVPVLTVDGSARVRITSQANPGFAPGNPRSPFPTTLSYAPYAWEPQALTGVPSTLTGAYLWTRMGLAGRDFDGQEIAM